MLWVLKNPSQWEGFFEHPKQMFKLMGKKKKWQLATPMFCLFGGPASLYGIVFPLLEIVVIMEAYYQKNVET